MRDIQKEAVEALKLCEHGNYHCMICEVRLLKLVIAEKDAEIAKLTEQRNRTLAKWGKTIAEQLKKEESL